MKAYEIRSLRREGSDIPFEYGMVYVDDSGPLKRWDVDLTDQGNSLFNHMFQIEQGEFVFETYDGERLRGIAFPTRVHLGSSGSQVEIVGSGPLLSH